MRQIKTFIFIHGSMLVGGVELYLIKLIRRLRENGDRVIWLSLGDVDVDETLKSDLLDGYVEIKNMSADGINNIEAKDFLLYEGDKVVAFAFDMNSFLLLEVLKKRFKPVSIHNFFWVTHFQGLFAEERIKNFKILGKIIIRKAVYHMINNNNILFANESHIISFEERYGVIIPNKEKVLIERINEILPFDEELVRKKSIRIEFNIITVTRFDFPHKAYLIGLIMAYGNLKLKYNNLSLTIIGYGKDEKKVVEEINKLSPNVKCDVHLVGKIAYDNLKEYFRKSHLNIGLAGAISDGALSSVISIPVRHYSDSCEAYGFLPESKDRIVSSEKGEPIEKFVEKVLEIDDQEYINLSRNSYNTFASIKNNNDILKYENNYEYKTLPRYILMAYKTYKKLRNIIKKSYFVVQ